MEHSFMLREKCWTSYSRTLNSPAVDILDVDEYFYSSFRVMASAVEDLAAANSSGLRLQNT